MKRDGAGWRLVLALGLGTIVLSGCSSSGASSTQPIKTTQVDLPPSYVFQPASIEVTPGSTVTWTNHDNFTHSVQVQGQSEIHLLNSGQTTQITFNTPGTYAYVCTFHTQNMKGAILVR